MRTLIPVAVLFVALLFAAPAQAQLRADAPTRSAPVAVYDQPGVPGLSLQSLFNAETVRVNHSYEFSYSSFGSSGIGMGVYTTGLAWQPNERLAARVNLGVAHSPFGSDHLQSALGFSPDQPARVFLQDATIAYRPTDNSVLTLSFQQSPFGSYHAPYGVSPFGYQRSSFRAASPSADALFWRTP